MHGKAVEIDESIFQRVNTSEGEKKIWVLGFYERGSKDMRAIYVKDWSE